MNERIVQTFIELVQVDSESRNEGKFHEFLKEKFQKLGLETFEDDTMASTGLGGNNLLFTLKGNIEGTSLFFSSHTDTVVPGVGIKPIIKDDVIYSDGTTILAADNKAGIAIMLELIEQIIEQDLPHADLEFILTPGEEIGLIGAAAFDINKLKSSIGFVLDNGGPIGSITLASPTLANIAVTIKGKTAHAGLEPEKGISAIEIAARAISNMKLGRVSKYTTANVGVINGGGASNIVTEEVTISAEARSIERGEFDAQVAHMKETFTAAASEYGGTVTFETNIMSEGYYFNEKTPIVVKAATAIKELGIEPRFEVSGGGSDANIFNSRNKEVVNLSIGYEKIHTKDEFIPIKEMVKAVELCQVFVKNALKGTTEEE